MKLFSLDYYNRELKKVLKQIDVFNEEYSYRTYVGNELKEKKGFRYKFIGSHVARRTFVSNHVREGTPINQIMKMTGHSSLPMIQKYMQIFGLDETSKFVDRLNLGLEEDNSSKELLDKFEELQKQGVFDIKNLDLD